jgi:hypothetical protein
MIRKPYSTDLTNAQWARIAPLIPPAIPGGRRRTVNVRDVVNAILYFVRTGCQWRNILHEFPPWGTVHYYYAHIRGGLVGGSVNSATLEYAEPDDYGDGDKDAQDGDGRHQLRQREASLVLPKTVWPLPQNAQDPILSVCSLKALAIRAWQRTSARTLSAFAPIYAR